MAVAIIWKTNLKKGHSDGGQKAKSDRKNWVLGEAGISLDGFVGTTNLTSLPVTVGQAKHMCSSGAPKFPIVEATISSTHEVLMVFSARWRQRPVLVVTSA